jgi:hypothetical protein
MSCARQQLSSAGKYKQDRAIQVARGRISRSGKHKQVGETQMARGRTSSKKKTGSAKTHREEKTTNDQTDIKGCDGVNTEMRDGANQASKPSQKGFVVSVS